MPVAPHASDPDEEDRTPPPRHPDGDGVQATTEPEFRIGVSAPSQSKSKRRPEGALVIAVEKYIACPGNAFGASSRQSVVEGLVGARFRSGRPATIDGLIVMRTDYY